MKSSTKILKNALREWIAPYIKKQEKYICNGFEPYIPSVHLKNIAPLEWLESKDGKDFINKLEEYEN